MDLSPTIPNYVFWCFFVSSISFSLTTEKQYRFYFIFLSSPTSILIVHILVLHSFHHIQDAAKKCVSSWYFLPVRSSWLQRTTWKHAIFLSQGAWVVEVAVMMSSMWFLEPRFRLNLKCKKRRIEPLRTSLRVRAVPSKCYQGAQDITREVRSVRDYPKELAYFQKN